jgi:hypothetical protein
MSLDLKSGSPLVSHVLRQVSFKFSHIEVGPFANDEAAKPAIALAIGIHLSNHRLLTRSKAHILGLHQPWNGLVAKGAAVAEGVRNAAVGIVWVLGFKVQMLRLSMKVLATTHFAS